MILDIIKIYFRLLAVIGAGNPEFEKKLKKSEPTKYS